MDNCKKIWVIIFVLLALCCIAIPLAIYRVCYCKTETSRQKPGSCFPEKDTNCSNGVLDVKRDLSSEENHEKISKALFPLVNLPSLYVKITLQFKGKATDNQTCAEKKFTWAQSCVFVSDMSLSAMTVFSLLTIWPQRRSTELKLTLKPLCNVEDDEDEMWKYILSSLQDISINPKVSDPRLNTAQCLVKGHEGDKDQPISCPSWYNHKAVIVPVSTVLCSIALSWSMFKWFENHGSNSNLDFVKACFLLAVCCGPVCFVIELIFVICLTAIDKCCSCFLLFCLPHLVLFVAAFLCNCPFPFGNESIKGLCSRFCFYPAVYQTVHHILWILLGGIPADPTWAFPLLLCLSLAFLSSFIYIYLYYKDNGHFWQILYTITATILTIIALSISFFGSNIALSENILAIAVGAVILWTIKNSRIQQLQGSGYQAVQSDNDLQTTSV